MNSNSTFASLNETKVLTRIQAAGLVREHLGALRNYAAMYAKRNDISTEEEERIFEELTSMWSKGIVDQLCQVLGIGKTARILNPFVKNG